MVARAPAGPVKTVLERVPTRAEEIGVGGVAEIDARRCRFRRTRRFVQVPLCDVIEPPAFEAQYDRASGERRAADDSGWGGVDVQRRHTPARFDGRGLARRDAHGLESQQTERRIGEAAEEQLLADAFEVDLCALGKRARRVTRAEYDRFPRDAAPARLGRVVPGISPLRG